MPRTRTSTDKAWVTPGNKVGILRKDQKLTQVEMAAVLQVSRGTISSYEGRQNANPSPETVAMLADYFTVELTWFYDGEDTSPRYLVASKQIRQPTLERAMGEAAEDDWDDVQVKLRGAPQVPGKLTKYQEIVDNVPLPRAPLSLEDPLLYRALTVAGNYMGARAPEGSTIYFRRTIESDDLQPGDIVLCRIVAADWFCFGVYATNVDDEGEVDHWIVPFEEGIAVRPWNIYYELWGVAETIVRDYLEGVANLEHNGGAPLTAKGHITAESMASRPPLEVQGMWQEL